MAMLSALPAEVFHLCSPSVTPLNYTRIARVEGARGGAKRCHNIEVVRKRVGFDVHAEGSHAEGSRPGPIVSQETIYTYLHTARARLLHIFAPSV